MRDLRVACFKEEGAFEHSLCLTCSSMAQIKRHLEKLLVSYQHSKASGWLSSCGKI